MLLLYRSGKLTFKKREFFNIGVGVISACVGIIFLSALVSYPMYTPGNGYIDDPYADTIIKVETPLVLLINGTWMPMPCQWFYAIPYCKLDNEGLMQVLKQDNISRYSEMIIRYECSVPRANMYATKQAAIKNSEPIPQWWSFWR
jgi:hypothetical protein